MNIVFDLDGTLIDSAPDIHFVACSLLRELGREEISLDEARSFIGEGSGVFVSRMMAARGLASEPGLHAELLGLFVSGLEASVELASFYAGVPELLNQLSSTGYMLGLCTNKPEGPTRALIRHMGIEASFSAVIAGGMLEHRKPAPSARQFHCHPRRG